MVTVLAVLLLIGAAGLTLYPLISNWVNDRYQSLVRTEYAEDLEGRDTEELEKARAEARAYNDSLSPLRYSTQALREASKTYGDLLNPDGSGIMGWLEIPKLELDLPVYHGTGESVLDKGVGHLTGSSLPVGGDGCHAVLTGHSGVAGKRLFSDLDRLEKGDVFYLNVLNDKLAYEVCDINRVLPHETELLTPVPGKDLCTLVTCCPYGVNTHRLLVRGERIPLEEADEGRAEAAQEPAGSTWREQYRKGLVLGGLGVLAAGAVFGVVTLFRRKRRRR